MRRGHAVLAEHGAEVAVLPSESGKVDLAALMTELARRDINEVHVEAGHKLNASLLRAGLVDELLVYLAPILLGIGRGMATFGPLDELRDGLRLQYPDAAVSALTCGSARAPGSSPTHGRRAVRLA